MQWGRRTPEVTLVNDTTVTVAATCTNIEDGCLYSADKSLSREQFELILDGQQTYAQILFGTDWDLDDIEFFFMSGICPTCWERLMAEPEDDEDENFN